MILIDVPKRKPRNRVRELTWALVDNYLRDSEWSELQSLLSKSAEARADYIEAMQLHVDLTLMHSNRTNAQWEAVEQVCDGL